MEDLRRRLDVIAIEQIALSTHNKPEASQNLRAKLTSNTAISLKDYMSPVKVLPPRVPLSIYDDVQKTADLGLLMKTPGHRITSPSLYELPDATGQQAHLNQLVNLTTVADSAINQT